MEKGGEGRRERGMGGREKVREGREKFNAKLKFVPQVR